jgi:hypothetical protein
MRVARHPRTASRVIDGVAVVVSIDNNRLFTLNRQATDIWQLLDRPRSVEELAVELCGRFDVDSNRAQADSQRFCEELVAKGLAVPQP